MPSSTRWSGLGVDLGQGYRLGRPGPPWPLLKDFSPLRTPEPRPATGGHDPMEHVV